MNKEMRNVLDKVSEDFLEEMKLKAIAHIKMYGEEPIPLLILKSRLGINYKFLSKILEDESYFEVESSELILDVSTMSVKVSDYGRIKFLKSKIK